MVFWFLFCLVWVPIRLFYPLKVIGKKNLPKNQGYIFACNHFSNLDPIIINIQLNKKIRYLAKKELFKNKFMAWIMKQLGSFPVDRDKTEVSTVKFALNTLKNGEVLGVFPEGTRNKSGTNALQEIKSGTIVFAGKADVPIVPVMFYRKSSFLKRNYLLIGEPFKVEAENSKKLTEEETEKNKQRLIEEMNKLVKDFEEKKRERKNKCLKTKKK